MKRHAVTVGCTLLLFAASLACHAQAFRTYLASFGSDSNPCTVQQPCRLLPAAIAAVADNGEIWILDSANFNSGTVSVTKSVSIRAIPGQVGSIVAVGGTPAMNLSAGVSVRMQNLAILNNAVNAGTDGIVMTTGALSIQDSTVAVPGDGIRVTGGNVEVRNVAFRGMTNGVHALGNSSVDVTGSKFNGASFVAVYLEGTTGTLAGSVSETAFTNCHAALGLNGNGGGTLKAMMTRSSVTNGDFGIGNSSGVNVTTNVGDSSFFNISTLVFSGAGIESMGNNQVRSYGAVGTITPVAPM